MNNQFLYHNSQRVKRKSCKSQILNNSKEFKTSKKTRDLLAEARAKVIFNLIESHGFLCLSRTEYKMLSYRFGLTKADIDRAINHLLDNGKILIKANNVLMLEAAA